MKNMKKIFFLAAAAAVILAATSCVSYQPVGMNDSFPQDCVVLGRVTLESRVSKAGYVKLLEAAQEEYPDAEDVVHVMVDTKRKINGKTYYVMSGLAVKYNR